MKEEKQHNRQLSKHWPVVLLALLVVVIFIVVMVTFQVKETEYALLKTYSGELVEYGDTQSVFSMPQDKRTESYITGRFG